MAALGSLFENICFIISGKATDIRRLYVDQTITRGSVSKITCHMSQFLRSPFASLRTCRDMGNVVKISCVQQSNSLPPTPRLFETRFLSGLASSKRFLAQAKHEPCF